MVVGGVSFMTNVWRSTSGGKDDDRGWDSLCKFKIDGEIGEGRSISSCELVGCCVGGGGGGGGGGCGPKSTLITGLIRRIVL